MLDLKCGMNFDLGHNLDLFNAINDSYQGDLRYRYAVDSFGYTRNLLGVGGGGGGGLYWFHSVRLSVCPACRVHFVTPTVMDGFFPY